MFTRCPRGHVYDAEQWNACPFCAGNNPGQTEKQKTEGPWNQTVGLTDPFPAAEPVKSQPGQTEDRKTDGIWSQVADSAPFPATEPAEKRPVWEPGMKLPAEMSHISLRSKIGKGASGTVYRAEQEAAVKVIPWDQPGKREQARREYAIGRAMGEQEGSIRYLGYCEEKNCSFLLQELAEPWFSWYRQHPCHTGDVLLGMLELLDTLEEMRLKGIAHFDIHPKNLFVSENRLKIGDYSHALLIRPGESVSGPRGTRPYMAPELDGNTAFSGTEDLYSAGITLYVLLSGGRLPQFGSEAAQSGETAPKRESGDRLRTLFLHPELIRIIEKATAIDPGERYQTPKDFSKDLNAFMTVHLELMKEEIPGYQPAKRIRPGRREPWPRPDLQADGGMVQGDTFFGSSEGEIEWSWGSGTAAPETNPMFRQEDLYSVAAPILPSSSGGMQEATPSGREPESGLSSAPTLDEVRFTAMTDRTARRGDCRILEIAMYRQEWEALVLQEMEREIGRDHSSYSSGSMQIRKNTRVTVRLSAPGIRIEEDQDTQRWNDEYLKFVFDYEVPENYDKNQIVFRAGVFFDDVKATTLRLMVQVEETGRKTLNVRREDVRSAFVSYSRKDILPVTYIVQALRAARPDMDIFFDLEKLRSGEHWEGRLNDELKKREVLYLCWSENAARSEWVEREWRTMLKLRGADAIEPIPLEDPERCPAPEDLAQLHFDGMELLIRSARRFAALQME